MTNRAGSGHSFRGNRLLLADRIEAWAAVRGAWKLPGDARAGQERPAVRERLSRQKRALGHRRDVQDGAFGRHRGAVQRGGLIEFVCADAACGAGELLHHKGAFRERVRPVGAGDVIRWLKAASEDRCDVQGRSGNAAGESAADAGSERAGRGIGRRLRSVCGFRGPDGNPNRDKLIRVNGSDDRGDVLMKIDVALLSKRARDDSALFFRGNGKRSWRSPRPTR